MGLGLLGLFVVALQIGEDLVLTDKRRAAGHHSVWNSSSTRSSPPRACDDLAERLELPLEAAADALAELEHALVRDRVVGEVALLTAGDDPRPVEHAEVLGNVLLRRPDQVGQLEHARLPLAQPVEQLDPRRLAQRAKALRDQLDQISGKRVRNGHPRLSLQRQRRHRSLRPPSSSRSSPRAADATSAAALIPLRTTTQLSSCPHPVPRTPRWRPAAQARPCGLTPGGEST